MGQKLVLVVALLLILGGAGVVGYLVGTSAAPGPDEAAAEQDSAREAAYDESYEASFAPARAGARRKGRASGERRGKTTGTEDGQAQAERRLTRLAAEPTDDASISEEPIDCDPMALPTPPGCPVPPDGPCGLYLELQPDGTCGPKTPSPAGPEDCPPGWVPAGIYGACAPRD